MLTYLTADSARKFGPKRQSGEKVHKKSHRRQYSHMSHCAVLSQVLWFVNHPRELYGVRRVDVGLKRHLLKPSPHFFRAEKGWLLL